MDDTANYLYNLHPAVHGCGEEAQDVKARRNMVTFNGAVFIITNSNQINVRKNKPKTFYFQSNKDDF